MKKLFGVLGVIFVIMLGGCALTMCDVGEVVENYKRKKTCGNDEDNNHNIKSVNNSVEGINHYIG